MNELLLLLNKYNRREQALLLGLAVFVVLYILWVAILSPLNNKRDNLIRVNATASESLSKVQIMSAQIQQLRSQGVQGQASDNINSLVSSSLNANGLKMDGFQPGPSGDVRVRLEMARYDALMQWLYDLEYRHGISILELSLSETRDAGLVTVNIRLQKN
jgi:general secretion pathway protein M